MKAPAMKRDALLKTICRLAIIAFMSAACVGRQSVALADWPVFGHDPARTGFAAGDATISLANVAKLHQRWVANFEVPADSAPVFVSRVRLANAHTASMLFVTARNGTTHGVDARTGKIVWSYSTRGPDITTSMPAVDPSERFLYAPGVDGFVHKLSASTGTELRGGGFPVRITWAPEIEKDASALNLANGFLYAVTSGYFGDRGHYVGHLVTVQLQDGKLRVFNALCSNIPKLLQPDKKQRDAHFCPQARAGIWSRGGAVIDPDPSTHGRVYIATGNGPFTANSGGHDYGDSVLAISADGARLVDYFTPTNFAELEAGDTDLGSTAPVMLPRQSASRTPLMAVQGGKDGVLRLLNREHLGGVGGEMQDINLDTGLFSAPAVWRDKSDATWIYVATASSLTALQLKTDASGKSWLSQAWTADVGGTSPIVANGIVFVARGAAINAMNARNGKRVWSSAQISQADRIGPIHWQSPIVVNGWIYLSDQSGHLIGYSL